MKRYYLGVDWSDEFHQVWAIDLEGKKVIEKKVLENVDGLAEFGRWLDETRAKGIELWVAIEKPAGRIIDFLLDHGGGGLSGQPQGVGSGQGSLSHEPV